MASQLIIVHELATLTVCGRDQACIEEFEGLVYYKNQVLAQITTRRRLEAY